MAALSVSISANVCLKDNASLEDVLSNSVQISNVGQAVVKVADDAAIKWNALKTMNNCA